MATISVIIPVYKVELYLRKCVDSVLSQTFQDFELILVDDGSPDSCPLICDEYAKIDSRVVVIHKQNGGLSSARNAGLDWVFANSDSEYISFIDSDDYVDDQFLELLYKAIKDSDMSLCYYVIDNDYSDSTMKNERFEGTVNDYNYWKINILKPNDIVAWNKLYSKHLFNDIRYPIGKLHEDEFVIHRIVGKCSKISIIRDVLYHYVKRKDSITSKVDPDSLEHQIYLIDIYLDRSNYYLSKGYISYHNYYFDNAISLFIKCYCEKRYFNKNKIKEIRRQNKIRKKLHLKSRKSYSLFINLPYLYFVVKKEGF